MDNVTSGPNTPVVAVRYIGATGPLKAVCEQVFTWMPQEAEGGSDPVLVIVWHERWLYSDCELWRELHEYLRGVTRPIRIPVTFFGETPEEFTNEKHGHPLSVLLQAIVQDARRGGIDVSTRQLGWASITNVSRFQSAATRWQTTEDSALLQLCEVCSALPSKKAAYPAVTLEDFFLFISEPTRFRASKLHGAKTSDEGRQGLRLLKWLAARALVPRNMLLKILLVENRPGDFALPTRGAVLASSPIQWSENASRDLGAINVSIGTALDGLAFSTNPLGFLKRATIYLVQTTDGFERLRSTTGRDGLTAKVWKSDVALGGEMGQPDTDIPWNELDLILQDIVLNDQDAQLTGLELVPHYFEACPQALVFLLTSLDVESLVGSGDVNWRYVDCIVSKNALETLWYEYRRCFRDRFGRMFWADWPAVSKGDGFDSRETLRRLFGCLRKWQIEPAILGHGQGVPEMIDHADRHIGCLWRLTDDFVGEFLENAVPPSDQLTLGDRMLLAIAVWLHDTGHRGDEFHDNPADVRTFHAGISERLLLRDPDAYGLEWLLDHCAEACRGVNLTGLSSRLGRCRNRPVGEGERICPLRAVGLLCRHHQSNAPLDSASFEDIQSKGKMISPYSRVRASAGDPSPCDYEAQLRLWTDPTKPLEGWNGSQVMTLEDFAKNQPSLVGLAGLLRMLDGIQLHRRRVGSPAAARSFAVYLSNRDAWAQREIAVMDSELAAMNPGTREYLTALGKRQQLESYRRLVNVQHVHYLQQLAVREVEVRWVWEPGGTGAVDVGFVLDERGLGYFSSATVEVPGLDKSFHILNEVLKPQNENFKQDERSAARRASDAILEHPALRSEQLKGLKEPLESWAIHVLGDFIEKEHNSQMPRGRKNSLEPYLRPLGGGTASEYPFWAWPLFGLHSQFSSFNSQANREHASSAPHCRL